MRVKNILIVALLLMISAAYIWYEANAPEPPDWTESYSSEDKIPYGTYIFARGLPLLFPEAELTFSEWPLAEKLERFSTGDSAAYVFINRNFILDSLEFKRLLRFVGDGNTLFVAAERISDLLLDRFCLNVHITSAQDTCHFTRPELAGKKYVFEENRYTCFEPDSGFSGRILGCQYGAGNLSDFVALTYGHGKIFLNLHPKAFTNYGVLDSIQGDYYSKAISYLPPVKNIILDKCLPAGSEDNDTPFRVILRYPALKWALYLLLFGGLLYVLFCIKREQRAMAVVRPPENRTLGFAEAVSSLYYRNRDHYSIAMKRIEVFMDNVRWEYKLRTDVMDGHFINLLSERSGIDRQRTEQLVARIREIRTAGQASPELLRKLVKQMEVFKFKTKKRVC